MAVGSRVPERNITVQPRIGVRGRAQLVGERGQELVFGPVGLLRARPRILRGPVQPRVVDGQRGPAPQLLGQVQVVAAEDAAGRRAEQAHDAEGPLPRHDGHHHHRAQAQPLQQGAMPFVLRELGQAVAGVRHQQGRFPGAQDARLRAAAVHAGREALHLLAERFVLRPGVGHGQPPGVAVLVEHVDHAPVGESGHGQVDELGQRLSEIEGRGQGHARFGQEGGAALGGLRGRARRLLADELDPLLLRVAPLGEVAGKDVDETLRREGSGRPAQPAVAPGLGGEAVLEIGDGRARAQGLELVAGGLAVVGVDELQEGLRGQLLVAEPEGALPARVELLEGAGEVRDGEHVEGEGEESVPLRLRVQAVDGLAELLLVLALLQEAHLLALALDLLRLLVEVHEHGDLGLEDLRDHGSADEVHCPQRIAAEDVGLHLVHGREEDDGRLLGARARADHLRGLEAVHHRHVHVEEDDREVLLQEGAQGLAPGIGAHHLLAEVAQDRFQG
jgi:hypothetical protein